MIQHPRFHRLRAGLAIIVSLLWALPAQAQIELASSVAQTQTHGWAVYKNAKDEVLLVHLPPRDSNPSAAIPITPAEPGELHPIRTLGKMPDAIAAIDERVYLVFPEVYSQGIKVRRVFSGRAVPIPVGSSWGFIPSDRLNAEPPIKRTSSSIKLAATSKSLFALLEGSGDVGGYTLLGMNDSAWVPIELPEPINTGHDKWLISAQGTELIAIDGSDPGSLRPYSLKEDGQGWDKLGWDPLKEPTGDYEILSGTRSLKVIDHDEEHHTRVRAWSKSGIFTLASGLDVPPQTRFASLDSVNRLVGIAMNPESGEKSPPERGASAVEFFEIDLSDASILYAGDPVVSVAVSVAEFRFLIGMMILIMIGVLVVVILPEKTQAMQIPDGFSLVDPGRRLSATLIDVLLVAFVISMIFHVSVIEILTLSVIARSDASWMVIPSVLISGVVIMSTLEWLLGWTPGKLMMGLRVVRAQQGAMERIPLWGAIVRNIIKWLVPPVAALALLDPEGLHRGDRITKSIVVAAIKQTSDPDTPDPKE